MVTGLLIGLELFNKLIIYCNCYAGLEYRLKHRDYITYDSDNSQAPETVHPYPLGHFIIDQKYLVPIIGIKLGLGMKYKCTAHNTAYKQLPGLIKH
jgi:hypothetical protein